MKFKSKIDWWIHLVFVLALHFSIVPFLPLMIEQTRESRNILIITGVVTAVLLTAVIIPIWLKTEYTITEKTLIIQAGLFIWPGIIIKNIIEVEDSRTFISSPALSMNRIKITYENRSGRVRTTAISPKDKEGFLKMLEKKRNLF